MSYKRVILSEFGGPEVLKVVEENSLPEPAQGEVRVKVAAVSATFTDTIVRKGQYYGLKKSRPFPRVMIWWELSTNSERALAILRWDKW